VLGSGGKYSGDFWPRSVTPEKIRGTIQNMWQRRRQLECALIRHIFL
jgi:hypothetical protein